MPQKNEYINEDTVLRELFSALSQSVSNEIYDVKFIEESRAKKGGLYSLERNCSVFATEAWKNTTDETIDASNGKTVLKTFGTEKKIKKSSKEISEASKYSPFY